MGKTKIEKIYAIIVTAVLLLFFISVIVAYFRQHNLLDTDRGSLINEDVDETSETITVDWANLYPFQDENNAYVEQELTQVETERQESGVLSSYKSIIDNLKYLIDYYTNHMIMGRSKMVLISSELRCFLGILSIHEDQEIIKMENGYLTFSEEKRTTQEIKEIADSLKEFNDFCIDNGTNFIYINAGSKVNPIDKQLNFNNVKREFTNENGSALLNALQEQNIDTVDLREEAISAQLDWYGTYYMSDHHWKNTTALWAAGVTAKKLNDVYGFNYDMSYFSFDSYDISHYEDVFLGSQGRILRDFSYIEDFDMVIPKYNTNYTIHVPIKELEITGEYSQSLIDKELFGEILNYSKNDYLDKPDPYHVSRIRNDANTIVYNNLKTNNSGKKILIMQDSFGFFYAGYLASDVDEVDIIFPSSFTGSIRAYIKEMKPNVVILMYYEGNIKPIDWTTHMSQFDMR